MSSKPRKSKIPKLRIPVAPPGYRHPSKKDYERVKKVDDVEDYDDGFYDYQREDWEDEQDAIGNLMWLLKQFDIKTARTLRVANYG